MILPHRYQRALSAPCSTCEGGVLDLPESCLDVPSPRAELVALQGLVHSGTWMITYCCRFSILWTPTPSRGLLQPAGLSSASACMTSFGGPSPCRHCTPSQGLQHCHPKIAISQSSCDGFI